MNSLVSDLSFNEVFQTLTGPFGAIAIMILALLVLKKERESVLGALAEERNQRIKALEERSSLCEKDRLSMREEFNNRTQQMRKAFDSLQIEVRQLYRGQIEAAKRGCGAACLDLSPKSEHHAEHE